MREIRQSGSEGGATGNRPYPYLSQGFNPWNPSTQRPALKGRKKICGIDGLSDQRSS